MAGPIIPVIAAVLGFITKSGIKAATKKYGKKVVDEAIDKKSAGQKARNYVSKAGGKGGSGKTTPRSVNTRLNIVEKEIRSVEIKLEKGSLTKGASQTMKKKRDALKSQRQNLLDMAAEDPDILGGADSMYGKFNKGGMVDYRKKGLFK